MPEDHLPTDAEIAERLAKIKDGLNVELDDIEPKLAEILEGTEAPKVPDEVHDEVFSRLDALEKKAAAAKQVYQTTKSDTNSLSGSMDKQSSVSMGLGFSMAYTIIGTPIAGYGLGLLINKLSKTQGWEIWLTLIGGILGIAWVAMVSSRNADKM